MRGRSSLYESQTDGALRILSGWGYDPGNAVFTNTTSCLPEKPGPIGQPEVAAMGRRRRIAWAEFLQQFEWSHFATLTTRTPITADRLTGEFKQGFIRRLAWIAQRPIPWFCALEYGVERSAPHLHALIANTSSITTDELQRAWKLGNTRITIYDPGRAAAFYVSKQLLDSPDNFDLSTRRPPLVLHRRAA